jgi:chorismate dehydratase
VKKVRVSTITYLNTVPLTWSLLRERPDRLRFELTVPSQCADRLAAGRADVGIIPSIEYQRIPGLSVLAGPVIASRDRVRSILLLSRKPLDQVRTLAVDTSSRTSVVLAELVLRHRYGSAVELRPWAPDPEMMLRDCDAAVLIGDPALRYSLHPYEGVEAVDLAAEWHSWTGLPFVFAFWAARRDLATPDLAQTFCTARDRGVAALPEIVPAEARARQLPEWLVQDYLSQRICYTMDSACQAGLDRFYALAAEQRLISRVAEVKYVEPAPAALAEPPGG